MPGIKARQWFVVLVLGLVFLPVGVLAKGGKGKSHPVRHVDTTPNTDNSDVVSLQVEDNFYDISADYQTVQTHYLNATIDYSMVNGFDVQLATYNCPVSGGGAQNYECDSYLNLAYTYKINQDFNFTLGSQNGTVFQSSAMQWHTSSYGSLAYQAFSWLSLRVGPYWIDKSLSTTTNYLGYTTGFNLNFSQDFYIQADYFSGSNNASGGTFSFYYKMFYVGLGVPEHNSGNEFYGIWGFKLPLFNI